MKNDDVMKIFMMESLVKNEFCIHDLKITISKKNAFEAIGFSKFVRLDGVSIGAFIKEITENGLLNKLKETLIDPQQIWVCLSGNEGQSDADCRCTVCIIKTDKHDFSQFKKNDLFTLYVPESEWANFQPIKGKSSTYLHKKGVYNITGEIGYKFNNKVGLHFDNEHEEDSGKEYHFLLPVICSDE
jgi:hypothetical protein